MLYDACGNIGSVIIDQGRFVITTDERGYVSIQECARIPLTPEWLERLGWQVVDQGSGPYYWLEKQCWFHIHLSADGSLFANFNNNAIPVNHLHQLQNLYYTLTGEELEIY
jgi:hypothetical protein